ncbi:hypothetical protein MLD52_15655 [Puniceicoccaceae bacterium K14]|nr:hypothetical protein [Puniceicoccaceae bacterium K14]
MTHQQTKNQAERIHQDALKMTNEELVEQMFHESQKSYFRESMNVSVPLSHFSVLISRYSEQAKKSSEINEKLQKSTLWLTIVIVVLTIALLLTIPQINDFVFGYFDDISQQSQNDGTNNIPPDYINSPVVK